MSPVVLYDDKRARTFEPFASARPISEMVAGIMTVRDRWEAVLAPGEALQFSAGAGHVEFDEVTARICATGQIPRGSIIVNSRAIPLLPNEPSKMARRAAACTMWRCGDRLAAVRVADPIDASALLDGSLSLEDVRAGTGSIGDVKGWWVDEVWDYVRLLSDFLKSDLSQLLARADIAESIEHLGPPGHATVLGSNPVVVLAAGASESPTVIEPHVVFDTTSGPIVIAAGAHVHAFTRINGPCYIGRKANVMGGDISGCSIGDVCKVRGELSNTVFAGYANKGHDGFVGHSYVGRWVNMGAGTITSNLKNTYGTVSLWTPSGVRDTGMQFLGTLFGDHVKTGIGLRLTTGTVLGTGANVYGNMPPKVVAPFSWGDSSPYSLYQSDKFLETAARMMSRRHIELSERARRHLVGVHARRWTVGSS
jgi:UDP-N-acetylglucosamine diphosphorylase/glucosamine-1-phosphate N-acetyltransferase